ncbi:MAG: hypothetical protein JST40_05055 [Armatimonadetes bacterium]|nr:hypothetical protein [Armatimonadota bacterium]
MISLQNPVIPVKINKTSEGYQLLRGGKPYQIKGVGGTGRMEDFAAAGGNSMRTWGSENASKELDACEKHGLTLMLGIWLGHKSYFDYGNPDQVKKQYESVKADVLKYRSHSALLIWGLGNEMELEGNDGPELWKAMDDLCRMVKELDPNHPTAAVVADIGPEKIKNINQYCPSLDILGINSYGGLSSLPERLKQAGWTRPYIVTEFGPAGPWESEKTAWGAAFELSSTEKAKKYKSDYVHSIQGQKGWCLGSYAFLWGYKQEETPTWFGMFLPSGERTEAVDVMSEAWGKTVSNKAPQILSSDFSRRGKTVGPGEALECTVNAKDPEGNALQYDWEIRFEASEKRYAGEGEKIPALVGDKVTTNTGQFKFKSPTEPAAYRLYLTVHDRKGAGASANWPFKVE